MQRILMTGASGLIGAALLTALEPRIRRGDLELIRLVRRPANDPSELPWDFRSPLTPESVSNFDTVIHLAGEGVVGRWSDAKKKAIRDSRVLSTSALTETMSRAVSHGSSSRLKTFVCASAIGYYGDRGDDTMREDSDSGIGFLPEVCREWEAASAAASKAGIRTVNLRTGLVLSRKGGALKPMLTPFKFGLGGRIGAGNQWWSWIHIDDMVGGIEHAIDTETISGPLNMTAPNPVRNAEFTKVLAKVLRRPAIVPVPPVALKIIFGEMATEEMFLASQRVAPEKLLASSYNFKFRDLQPALSDLV